MISLHAIFLFRKKTTLLLLVFFGMFSSFFALAQDSIRPDSSKYSIRSISYSGNKQTKVFIMARELSFKVGDTLTGTEFQIRALRSHDNLLNTALFNFVTITSSCTQDSVENGIIPVAITITVKERWYTWPAPIFDVAEQNFNVWWRNGHNLNRASYGFFLWRYNFRGRKESIALICRFGYSQQFGGQYSIPYANKEKSIGLTFTGTYTRNHEVSFATQNNKLLFYKNNNGFTRGETAGSIMITHRWGLYLKQTLDLRYTNLTIIDTVTKLTSDYFAAGRSQMEYFTISYRFTRDYRDIKAYPLNGNMQDVEITKLGLGILADEKLNLFFITASARQYLKLFHKTYFSAMIKGRWTPSSEIPYYHQRALGFSNYIRGYEYYVIDGQNYVYAKTAIRYQVLKPHVIKVPFVPLEKFNVLHIAIYTGIFADAGYVQDRNSVSSDRNFLGNAFLFGYGAGIDVVTYYDVVIRIEYSLNKRFEKGFFLHMGTAF